MAVVWDDVVRRVAGAGCSFRAPGEVPLEGRVLG